MRGEARDPFTPQILPPVEQEVNQPPPQVNTTQSMDSLPFFIPEPTIEERPGFEAGPQAVTATQLDPTRELRLTGVIDGQKKVAIVRSASGARYIVPWFGMSLRDRQRAYYFDKLDTLFPGMRRRYEERFGDQYSCPANNATRLEQVFTGLCQQYDIATRIIPYAPVTATQLRLF